MKRLLPALLATFILSTSPETFGGGKPLVVHEWGTFTSLQDEQGNSIGAINNDDEPVPGFVHNIAWDLLIGDAKAQEQTHKNVFAKSVPRAHRDVTMRLETPVLYVHQGCNSPKISVTVDFRGGLLTQFYPKAETARITSPAAPITSQTTNRLTWSDLRVNQSGAKIPQTKDHVWLAPRNVDDVATLTNNAGESEKYLFYRGVGHLDAPLRAVRGSDHLELSTAMPGFGPLWYCTIKADGSCAWRSVESNNRTPARFSDAEFSAARLDELKKSMHAALVSEGLYKDEAQAMLDTWAVSYFKSAGTRIFYIVPQAWTEQVLPMQISPKPDELKRVMVGRLDVVTPDQRDLLKQIVSAKDVVKDDAKLWQVYDRLGRFRNALVLNELARTKNESLKQFIANYGLDPFTPAPVQQNASVSSAAPR